jgi:hypothetical protein
MIVARSQSFQADFSSLAFMMCLWVSAKSYTALRGKERNGVFENGYMMGKILSRGWAQN